MMTSVSSLTVTEALRPRLSMTIPTAPRQIRHRRDIFVWGDRPGQDPAVAPCFAAVHPVGIEHDVLAQCCSSSFRWLLLLRSTERRGRHDAGTAGGPRYRPYRGAGPPNSERSVGVVVGARRLVCTLSGRLPPDRIRWPAARNPGFGFGGGTQRPVPAVALPVGAFGGATALPLPACRAGARHERRSRRAQPAAQWIRTTRHSSAGGATATRQIEPLAPDPPPPAPGRPQA
jgi:hypothetical protein